MPGQRRDGSHDDKECPERDRGRRPRVLLAREEQVPSRVQDRRAECEQQGAGRHGRYPTAGPIPVNLPW